MDEAGKVEHEGAGATGGPSVFRALSMRPSTRSLAQRDENRHPRFQRPQIATIAPGAAVSTFAGPNFVGAPERAVFLGGALICLTFSGLRASRAGSREIELSARENCVALLSPQPIEVASMPTSQKTRRTVAAFISLETLDRFDIDLFGSQRDRSESVGKCRVTPAARGLATELLRPEVSDQVRQLRAEALVLELLAEFKTTAPSCRTGGALQTATALAAVRRARDIIAADPAMPHSLVSLADAAGISVTTLKRDFQRAFGTSPIAFLRKQRLELGRSLIESQGLSVSSAAYACGYDHPGNFTQAFRRHFGFAPSSLRR